MQILKGYPIRKKIEQDIKKEIIDLCDHMAGGRLLPHLAIVQVGDNSESNVYIEQKRKFATEAGIQFSVFKYSDEISLEDLKNNISRLADMDNIHGIIIQLPLPQKFSRFEVDEIIDTIPANKDADGLTSINAGYILKNSPKQILPATTRGIIELLNYYNIPFAGKHVVVIGRSSLVGKPTGLAFLNLDATITLCHRKTPYLSEVTKSADIIISAAGVKGLINKDFIKDDQVLVDVGISIDGQGISGDADKELVNSSLAAISPVPGGVGPMTVSGLFLNLIDLYKKQIG